MESVMQYSVIKRHKRLAIVDDEGNHVYCPPSFITLPNRQVLIELAARLSLGASYIKEIVAFETRLRL